jgi:hypothetical protein
MRRNYIILLALIFSLLFLFKASPGLAETRDDKQEAAAGFQRLQSSPTNLRFSSSAAIFAGYDSNVELLPVSKGDVFEEFLYSLGFIKPWAGGGRFTLNYDLDAINYNEVTDAAHLLNHGRLGVHQKIVSWLTAGTGYDLGYFYYSKSDDDDLLRHSCFFYVRNNFSKKFYQQLLYESGLKDYQHRKALGTTISTYQDKERKDYRQSLEYTIAASLVSQWFLKLKGEFLVNDSNAIYLAYYDYKSYEISPSVNYSLSEKARISSSFSFTRRDYDERLVTLKNFKQKDYIYSASAGMQYDLNKKNSLYLLYTYRNNASNEPAEKYTENMVTCCWQYNF